MTALRAWMRASAASLLVTVSAAQIAHAQPAPATPDPATLAAAQQLIRDTGGNARMNKVLDMMRTAVVPLLQRRSQQPDQVGRIYDEILLPAMRAHLPELERQIATLYAADASLADLQALDAFYRSPLGRKALALQDKATPQMMALGAEWGRQMIPDVLKANADALRQQGIKL